MTNRYLDLVPVVEASAAELDKRVLLIHNSDDAARQIRSADWAIVDAARSPSSPPASPLQRRLWTDDRSDFFHLIK